MVVIGGLVGAGALGYDVVAGFKQLPLAGHGLAAGFSIVLLGVMLDRITTLRGAAGREEGGLIMIASSIRLATPLAVVGLVARGGRAPGVGSEHQGRRRRDQGVPCGTLNIAVNNWVGYEADAFVVGEVAKKRLGCIVNYVNVDEQISWQGFASGAGRRRAGELGSPRADRAVRQEAAASPQDAGQIGNQRASSAGTCRRGCRRSTPTSPNWKNLNKYASCSRPRSRAARASSSTATRAS